METIDGDQDLVVEFDEGGAVLAKAAVVFGKVAEVDGVGGRQGAQAGLAALGPGKHGGGVKRALWGGAVAGRLAAAGLQFIDGAFEELAKRQQVFEALPIVSQQRPYVLAQAAGALGNYALAPASALVRVPAHLPAADAAPLCCAGWTAYGALREAALAPGQSVALFGYGGLGHLALQIALHQGLRAAVSDPSEEKLALARAAGADTGALRNMDAAIVFTAAPAAIPQAFRLLRCNGTLILVGLAVTSYELPLVDTVLKGITIRGSYLGSRDDLAAVFALAGDGVLRPHVHTHALDEAPALLDRRRRGEPPGRAVIAF